MFSKTTEKHMKNLRLVIELIAEHGLKIKTLRCSFVQRNVKLLEHLIDSTGVHVDPDKIEAIQSYPRPGV